jgi:hypothetical protein
MKGADERLSEVQDFREVLSNPIDGQLPLLVGGHAVNLWSLFYRDRIGREMDQWLPLTSKDLDLFGTLALLEGMKSRFGSRYRLSGPRSPVVGQLVVTLAGIDRQIDVLRGVPRHRFPRHLAAGTADRRKRCPTSKIRETPAPSTRLKSLPKCGSTSSRPTSRQ